MSFTFRQFHIEQDKCAMKVGTDGVLLGSWAKGGKRILDIGTGTGLIALMMAQRFPDANIDAIEIDENAVIQATENVLRSPFTKQIVVKHCSLQTYSEAKEKYDSIVCNPPYFVDSLKNNDNNRTVARHTDTLPFNELIKCAYQLLTPNGHFSLVLPVESYRILEPEAILNGFSVIKKVLVKTTPSKQPKRILVELGKVPDEYFSTTEYLQDSAGNKSEWYKEITKEFYLK
ncbi:tRNA1(Val) (adenine(37)-N6)-methyltransferase [Prevotella intermedia]|uniref:tRNA1(Val) (adenine(37)-N6)-methyltransferase n=1 Tax=Prevotella intermedia TaxID=28131 RepID=A0A3R8G600_PREIN|nr:methyltransferase [Prevotella intermedia]RQE03499.1 methyltransferase domain-containing protein [Prevotella intermedia]RRF87155.1 methyltransferase domain-containing protein [Prevotella intermedia]